METDVELQGTATGFQDYYFFFFFSLTVTPPLSFPSSLEKLFFLRHKSGVSQGLPCLTSSSRYLKRSP